jgi:hypothetical protein
MNKFRPQDTPKRAIIKQRLKYGRSDNYNWQTRIKWYPAGWGFNKKVIGTQHSRLHYLACHAPEPIQKRWSKVYDNFMAKHFGTKGKASVRYLNTWSCHSWM